MPILYYSDLGFDYSDELLRNSVTIQRTNGIAQLSEDATSVTNYLRHSYSRTGLIHNSDATSLDAANFFVSEYKNPLLRITSMQILARRDPANLFPQVLGRELTDRVTVRIHPQALGLDINQTSVVEGIEMRIDASEHTWETRWSLSPAYAGEFFQLDKTSGAGLDSMRIYF